MTDDKQPFDKVAFELQYEKWMADQISDQEFYDYINEHGIDMNVILDPANERKRLSEVKPPQPGDDILKDIGTMPDVFVSPTGGMVLDQCLKCRGAVMQAQAMPDKPFIWLHIDADKDYDHLPKVLTRMAIDDITGLVNDGEPLVKNAGHKWDTLNQAARYRVLHIARATTDEDYPPENKFVPGHTEDLRRALDATGGPIEQD